MVSMTDLRLRAKPPACSALFAQEKGVPSWQSILSNLACNALVLPSRARQVVSVTLQDPESAVSGDVTLCGHLPHSGDTTTITREVLAVRYSSGRVVRYLLGGFSAGALCGWKCLTGGIAVRSARRSNLILPPNYPSFKNTSLPDFLSRYPRCGLDRASTVTLCHLPCLPFLRTTHRTQQTHMAPCIYIQMSDGCIVNASSCRR